MLPQLLILSFLALSFCGAQAAMIRRAPECESKKMWPIMSNHPKDDVILADRYVGLSAPVKATLFMIFELEPKFLYAGAVTDRVNECMLRSNRQSMRIYQFAARSEYCSLHFPFSLNPEGFKQPIGDTSFGILPLIVEKGFNALQEVPASIAKWSNGYNPEDIAQNIQIFFSRITPVPLNRHPVSEIVEKKDSDLETILDSAVTSPVFLVTRDSINIVTAKGTNGWQGYDIKSTSRILSWTASEIRDPSNGMSLIYNVDHRPIRREGVQLEACPEAKAWGLIET